MSRHIPQRGECTREEEQLLHNEISRLVITHAMDHIITLLIKGNRLTAARVWENTGRVGAVYLCKVKKIVKNIEACFVEIADGELCYLPLSEARQPFLVNRKWDGRLLEGDEFPVQVVREALKSKQASVTTRITLTGRLLVLAVGSDRASVSAKLSVNSKSRLLDLLRRNQIITDTDRIPSSDQMPVFGLIIRTQAGSLLEEQKLLDEYHQLLTRFSAIFHNALHRTCFSCLLEPPGPLEASLEIAANHEYQEVVTDIPSLYPELQEYFNMVEGRPGPIVRLYQDKEYSLSRLYSVDTKLKEAIATRVWLKSGGYLVIEPTEALTVIDVNSGKNNIGKNKDDTILSINMEAAAEAAHQIRLRNLSGIIIIDFINMKPDKHKEELLDYLRLQVHSDTQSVTVVDMTPLGLIEITRRKRYRTLKEQLYSS